MKYLPLVFCLLLLTSCITMENTSTTTMKSKPSLTQTGTATESPETVLYGYFNNLNNKRYDKSYSYLSSEMKNDQLYSYAKNFESYQNYMNIVFSNISRFEIKSVDVISVEDSRLELNVLIESYDKQENKNTINGKTVLVKENNEWKIRVPY